jgi:hypothetical protein
MGKNRENYKDLCASIVEIMKMLQDDITRHGATAASRLEELCRKLRRLVICMISDSSAHSTQFATRNSAGTWTLTKAAERHPWPS